MDIPVLFIIGAPRSGNTILGRSLAQHPRVSPWFEPYYVWDRYFRSREDDQRDETDVTPRVISWIRGAYQDFWNRDRPAWIVDKSPRNCLKIPFIQRVFPEAHFIFLLRDGRDVVLSIRKQWNKRRRLAEGGDRGQGLSRRGSAVKKWLVKRPTLKHRIQALTFEIGSPRLWLQGRFRHRDRWRGRAGWGPRFRGWLEVIDRVAPLEFYALQWIHCVAGIRENLQRIAPEKRMMLRYEDFIADPESRLGEVLAFLRLEFPDGLMDRIPRILSGNAGKWADAFSSEELALMGPIVGRTLVDLGYERDDSWYTGGVLGREMR